MKRSTVRLFAALLAPVLLALCGCAGLKKAAGKDDRQAAAAPAVRLQVEAPGELAALVERNLDLARLPALAPGVRLSDAELDRLIAVAPAQTRSLLETEGYFNADVKVERLAGDPPTVRVAVDPGPRARVRDVRIEVQGPLAQASAKGNKRARRIGRELREQWSLPKGTSFRNPAWNDAKVSTLAQLRAQGYLVARWLDTTARVDAATQEVDLTLRADSGPLYRTGDLRVRGLHFHDEKTVRNLADFKPGTPATQELLLDFQKRLQASTLFDGASVVVDPDGARPDAAPVTVTVTERKLQDATVGLGVSSDVGPRVTLEHTHRRPFGRAAIARNRFELSRLRQSWEGELSTHTLPRLYRNLIGGRAQRLESDEDVVTSYGVRIGRAKDTERIDRLLFAEYERSLRRTDDAREEASAIAVHHHGVWRRVDDVLLPTRGHVIALQTGVGHASSNPGGRGPFLRLYGELHSFWPVASWYGTTRLELGQVFVRSGVTVPEPLRFRAGGDESVRGYEYRSLAPTEDGDLTSGRVLFTGSVELARPILARLPELWGATFVDVGNAADRWSQLDPVLGVGVGLRYRSPIGPVRLDLAYGEAVDRFRLHLSVGVTF
jgi:translocation and assembly module TamA